MHARMKNSELGYSSSPVWKNSNDYFSVQNFCNSDFSSEVLDVLVNCKVHFPEDIISWQPAKTVWQSMQMRAQEVSMKTGTKSIFRTLPYILHVRPLLAQKFMHHANDVPPDFSNVLLNLCQNCKMHFVEDVISWWTAKTVRKFMQMRAQEKFCKTTPKVCSFVCSMSKTCDLGK